MKKLLLTLLFVPIVALASDHCDTMLPFGKPVAKEPNLTYVCRKMYVLEHSPTKKSAVWVAEKVTPANFVGDKGRTNLFKSDPALNKNERAYPSDYRNSGFDRGHLAPAANMDTDVEALAESFYLSNIIPQHPLNNRNGWKALEEKVRDLAKEHGEVYVITGPVYFRSTQTIGTHKVAVPSHIYKIVTDKDGRVLTAILSHNKPIDKIDLPNLEVSVELIEDVTGIDFLPGLDAERGR